MTKKSKLSVKESKSGTTLIKSDVKITLTKSETNSLYRHLANLDHVSTSKVYTLNDLVPVVDEYNLLKDYISLAMTSANSLDRIFRTKENRGNNKLTISEKVDVTQHSATLDASIVEVNGSIKQLNHLLRSSISEIDLSDVYMDDGYTTESLYFIKEKLQNVLGASDEA